MHPTLSPHPRSLQLLGEGCQDIWGQSPAVTNLEAQVTALQTQVNKLQAEVDTLIGRSNTTIPFNSAECLAKNITSFKTDYAKGPQWVAVDFFPLGSNAVCERSTAGTTCSNICARAGLTCDPCAIAKVSCQDALYYALTEAGKGIGNGVGYVQQLSDMRIPYAPPGVPGPWPATTCAATGVAQVGFFAPANKPSAATPYPKQFGWAQQVCDPAGDPILTDFYSAQKNYWDSSDSGTYIDPATLCNLPIVTRDDSIVMFSGLCYCTP